MRILAVSAHPDDETLGAGGTLLAHSARGDELHWFIATAAFEPTYGAGRIARQRTYVEKLTHAYPMKGVHWPRLPTGELDRLGSSVVIEPLRAALREVRPHVIYTVGPGDVHTDHAVVFDALLACSKSFQRPPELSRILAFEVISSTDVYPAARPHPFVPNVFSSIGSHLERKLELMSILEDELHAPPLPRSLESIRALAQYRGSTIGSDAAEAFHLVFEVM